MACTRGAYVKPSILFIGKRGDAFCQQALDFVQQHFPECVAVLGCRGDRFPESLSWWRGDVILSYLSPWIIPGHVLRRARRASINFHPGPPEYPGIGCTNFAIFNNEKQFGVTCHHMAEQVDTGPIIAVRRFPVQDKDTVLSLTRQCYAHLLALFYEMAALLLDGADLPCAPEQWTRPPYRRAELEALCRVLPEMSEEEIRRRVRAVDYPDAPGAYLELAGIRFEARP
jgi:methionyl-tRNA formyltransferase